MMKRKSYLWMVYLLIILTGCSKSGGLDAFNDSVADGSGESLENLLSSATVKVTAPPFNGVEATNTSELFAVKAPVATNVVLKVNISNNKQLTDIKWYLNNQELARGNDVQVSFPEIGHKPLKVEFKISGSDVVRTKNLTLKVYKAVFYSIVYTSPDTLCGPVEIGQVFPLMSSPGVKGSIPCPASSGKTITQSNLWNAVPSNNTSLAFMIQRTENKTGDLVIFDATTTKNLSPGTYKIRDLQITIENR